MGGESMKEDLPRTVFSGCVISKFVSASDSGPMYKIAHAANDASSGSVYRRCVCGLDGEVCDDCAVGGSEGLSGSAGGRRGT